MTNRGDSLFGNKIAIKNSHLCINSIVRTHLCLTNNNVHHIKNATTESSKPNQTHF